MLLEAVPPLGLRQAPGGRLWPPRRGAKANDPPLPPCLALPQKCLPFFCLSVVLSPVAIRRWLQAASRASVPGASPDADAQYRRQSCQACRVVSRDNTSRLQRLCSSPYSLFLGGMGRAGSARLLKPAWGSDWPLMLLQVMLLHLGHGEVSCTAARGPARHSDGTEHLKDPGTGTGKLDTGRMRVELA